MSRPWSDASPSVDVVGADANNLRNADISFPLNAVSVVTGVSGSGKTSLLADTLAAEGSQRARTFLDVAQGVPTQDYVGAFVSQLPPTVLVGQRGFRPNVRTTVGTATGFLSVLRRLFLLASTPCSDRTKERVPPPSPDVFAQWISRHYRGTVEIWAAPVRTQRTDGVAAVKRLASHGLTQVVFRSETDAPRHRERGRVISSSGFAGVNPNVRHTIEALVATVDVVESKKEQRLRDLLATAFLASNGSVVVMLPAAVDPELAGPYGSRLDSTRHCVHPGDADVFAAPSQHLLSFNAPEHQLSGACRACRGTGVSRQLREHALVANPGRPMHGGAFAIWTPKNYKYVNIQHDTIEGLRGIREFSPDVPWEQLPESARALVLDGSGEATCLGQGSYRASLWSAQIVPRLQRSHPREIGRHHQDGTGLGGLRRDQGLLGLYGHALVRASPRIASRGLRSRGHSCDDLRRYREFDGPTRRICSVGSQTGATERGAPESSCEGSQACRTWLPDSRPGNGRCQRRREPPGSSRPGAGCRRAGLLSAAG